MNSNIAIPRNVIVYGLCVPLAILMGYLLTTPLDLTSVVSIGSVLCLLLVPVFLRWHHFLLIVSWNAVVTVFFLPGQPRLWMVLSLVSLSFSILDRVMNKEKRLQNIWWLTTPLLFLVLVILVTAKLRGGIGLRALGGSSYGGKKYLETLLAILGFFAISCRRIPFKSATTWCSLYFLSGITSAVSNLAYASGFFWLFWLFPIDNAVMQIQSDYLLNSRGFSRLVGVAFACIAPFCFLLLRHGIKGTFQVGSNWSLLPINFRQGWYVNQPYRAIFLVSAMVICSFGGFRSMPLLLGLIFVIQAMMERLYKTRMFYGLLAAGVVCAAAIYPFTERLPMVVQRAISFLPVKVNPIVKADAWASTDWRLRMWKMVSEDIGKTFWVGKGYGGSATDFYFARESSRRGYMSDFESAYLAGDYHSGPLSVLVPLGIFGVVGFLWFLGAGGYALYRNYHYGSKELETLNRFLYSFFIAEVIFYMLVFGDFATSLNIFTGLVGLSLAVNGGVARVAQKAVQPAAEPQSSRVPVRPGGLPGSPVPGRRALA